MAELQTKEDLDNEFLSEHENDESLLSLLTTAITPGRNVPTTQRQYFGRKLGTHGFVSFSYQNDPGMPPRFPARKELIIKQIFVKSTEKSVVNSTCDALLANKDLQLNKIILESIQHPEWIPSLERQGWTIYGDYTTNAFKERKLGGRKTRRKRRKLVGLKKFFSDKRHACNRTGESTYSTSGKKKVIDEILDFFLKKQKLYNGMMVYNINAAWNKTDDGRVYL